MTDAILIDTNVLVYAHDRGEPAKQQQAIETLEMLRQTGRGRLSAQILAEFVRAATKGRSPTEPALSEQDAAWLDALLRGAGLRG